MKKSLCLAGLLLAGNLYGASSSSEDFYVGLGFYKGSGTETNEWSNSRLSDTKVDYDSKAFPLSIGMITSNNDRVELSYINADIDTDEGRSFDIRGLDLNYDFTLESLKFDKFLPYVGVGLGIYKFQDSGSIYNIKDNKDLKGVALNANLGLLYLVSQNIEFEAVYQFKKINWQELESEDDNSKLQIDEETHGIYIGFNYKF